MHTLIINGSPRRNGDTAFLLEELKKHLNGSIDEINVYFDNIKPCIDCRKCQKSKGCAFDDDMQKIYRDDFQNVVIASPIYMSNLTAPLIGLASRFQAYYCAERFLKDAFHISEKKAALILTGGGDGGTGAAVNMAKWMFQKMHAEGYADHMVFSLHTDDLPANQDIEGIRKIHDIASYFNSGDNIQDIFQS